jgi:hypothetical protein
VSGARCRSLRARERWAVEPLAGHDRACRQRRDHHNQYDGTLNFKIDLRGAELLAYASFAMHWSETCQNDGIEGLNMNVYSPLPGTALLLAVAWTPLGVARRRRGSPAVPLGAVAFSGCTRGTRPRPPFNGEEARLVHVVRRKTRPVSDSATA